METSFFIAYSALPRMSEEEKQDYIGKQLRLVLGITNVCKINVTDVELSRAGTIFKGTIVE